MPTFELTLVAPATYHKYLVGRYQCKLTSLRKSCNHIMRLKGLLASQLHD